MSSACPKDPPDFDSVARLRRAPSLNMTNVMASFGFRLTDERHAERTPRDEILIVLIGLLGVSRSRLGRPPPAGSLAANDILVMGIREPRRHVRLAPRRSFDSGRDQTSLHSNDLPPSLAQD